MQWIVKQLGVHVVITPKAYPELVGQGVEYSWGYAKLCFRKNNTACSAKEKAQQLEANVLYVTSTNDEQSLNLEHVQKFVWKARDYKMVYQEHFKTLELKKLQAEMTTNETMEIMEEKRSIIVWKTPLYKDQKASLEPEGTLHSCWHWY